MTDPKSLSTPELVCEMALADALMRQTHSVLQGAEAERYRAATLELTERYEQSWIATGEQPRQKGFTMHDPRWELMSEEAKREASKKHHLTFDIPTPGPLVREP